MRRLLAIVLVVSLIFNSVTLVQAEEPSLHSEEVEITDEVSNESSNTEAVITGEVTSERTENTKTFRMSDGSYMLAQYPVSVHKMTQEDTWEEIGEIEQVSTYSLRNNNSSISNGDYVLSWSYSDADMSDKTNCAEETSDDWLTVDNVFQATLYEEIYENVDLKVTTGENLVKDDIILKTKDARESFSVEYYVEDLEPVEGDNIILLTDSEGEVQFQLTAPCMYDSAGEVSEKTNISLESVRDDGFTVTVTGDREWLNQEERVYPITIDPVVNTNQNATDIASRYYVSGTYDPAHGTLFVGLQKGGLERVSSALKFNLPTLKESDLIINAQLHLGQRDYSHVGVASNTINVYPITQSWTSSTSVPGVVGNPPAYDSRVCDYYNVSAATDSSFVSWDITSTAKKWYNGSLANNGLLVKANDETKWAITRFCSPQNVTFSTSSRPIITIQYVNVKGLNAYHEYANVGQGYNYNLSVNKYTGNLVYDHSFQVDSGNRTSFDISLTYNSEDYAVTDVVAANLSNKIYLGKGFRGNFTQRVTTETISNVTYYVQTDRDGTKTYFKPIKQNNTIVKWQDEYDAGTVLTVSGSHITITYEDGSKQLYYKSSGCLYQLIDQSNNTFTFAYGTNSAAPISITDPLNRKILFEYDAANYLKSITDVRGEKTTFSYNANGYLTQIKDPFDRIVSYSYDATGRLSSVQGPQNIKHTISYIQHANRAPKAQYVCEYANEVSGSNWTFAYGDGATAITDRYGNTEGLIFDYLGRIISKFDQDRDIIGTTYNSNHQITETNSEHYVDNHLLNGSVKNQSYWSVSRWGSDTTVSMSVDATTHYYGTSSLKVSSSNQTDNFYGWANGANRIKRNTTYTFSAYVKTSNVAGTSGAVLAVAMQNSSQQNLAVYKSEPISGTNDWKRISFTFTTPSDTAFTNVTAYCGLDNASGTVWFDNLQLEEGAVANNFNYLDNGSLDLFSGHTPYMWDTSNVSTGSGYSTIGDRGVRNGVGIVVRGYPDVKGVVRQLVNVPLTEGQVISVSGWAKSLGVPLDSAGAVDRYVAINVAYNYVKDGATKRYTQAFNFSDETSLWQYLNKNIVILGTTSQLEIAVLFYRNANQVVFDDLQLFIGETGSSYEYNTDGTLKTTYQGAKKTSYSYDTNRNLTGITYPDGTDETIQYDDKKRIISATDVSDVEYHYTYDTYGNPLTMTVGTGSSAIRVVNTYTSDGNSLASVRDSNGKMHYYTYDAITNLLQTYTDPNGNVTSYTYTDDYRLHTVTCGTSNVTYSYDDYNLTSITTGGKTYYMEMDDFHDSVERIKIGSLTLIEHLYAANNGRLEESTYGNDTTIGRLYDSETDDTLVGKSINGTVVETYQYDATDSLGVVTDNKINENIIYQYDALGRVSSELESRYTNDTTYSYDAYGRLKERKTYTGVVNEKYGTRFGVSLRNNLTTATLNDKNQLASSCYGYGNIFYSYDTSGRIVSSYIYDNSRPTTEIMQASYSYASTEDGYSTYQVQDYTIADREYGYTYDNNGNILSISENDTVVAEYTYDHLNQLTSETRDGKVYTYSYDSAGNMQTIKEDGTVIKTYGYGDSNWPDKLTSYNNQTLTYDEIGNPLTYKDGESMTWQDGRRLNVITNGGETYVYEYDSSGRRISKTVNGAKTEYVWSDGKIIEERLPDGSLLGYHYDACGNSMGFDLYDYEDDSMTFFYYIKNLQGDVVALTDRSGNIVAEYSYDAWGNVLTITGSRAATLGRMNPIRYRGYYYDSETGFYYVSSRYYDPEIGRFINADNAISGSGESVQGYNLYAYCFNNPVNMSDPTGKWPKFIEKIGSRIVNAVKIAVKIVTSPFKAIKASVGIGVGIGGEVEATVSNVPIAVGISTSTTDSISYDKGKIDIKNTTSTNIGFNTADIIDISYSEGKEHSYMDSNCTCNFLHTTFGQKQQCSANRKIVSSDTTLGFSIGAYLLVGGEISIGIDLNAWGEELISIFDESISYED